MYNSSRLFVVSVQLPGNENPAVHNTEGWNHSYMKELPVCHKRKWMVGHGDLAAFASWLVCHGSAEKAVLKA